MPMFGALSAMARRAVNPGERFMLAGNIEASLFMVPGKLPLYLEGEEPALDMESAANVGIELQCDGARIIFVPGAAAVTRAMRERCARADVILFDGTLFTDDEMIRAGAGRRPAGAWDTCRSTARAAPSARSTGYRAAHFHPYQQHQSDADRGFARTPQGRGRGLGGRR